MKTKTLKPKPSSLQILSAKVRAAREKYEKKHRVPYEGGYIVPSNMECYRHLSAIFGMTPVEISYFFTYSRTAECTHSWSAGACIHCPVPLI